MSEIERIEERIVEGKRLGRHIDHEARRAAKPYAKPRKAVQSVNWKRDIPILDQGNVGSCTGNAMCGCLGTDTLYEALPASHPALDENEALSLYSAAEVIDGDGPYPPNDNGSTGPSVAQAAQNAGLIAGYQHYTDLDSVLQALQDGPVMIGSNWYDSMDIPAADGTVTITPGATVRGGHEYEARRLDVASQMIGCDNSWGTSWGVNGSFQMSYDTLTRLLAENGDCTVPEPLAGPPVPPPPEPQPPSPPSPPVPPAPSWFDRLLAWILSIFGL